MKNIHNDIPVAASIDGEYQEVLGVYQFWPHLLMKRFAMLSRGHNDGRVGGVQRVCKRPGRRNCKEEVSNTQRLLS